MKQFSPPAVRLPLGVQSKLTYDERREQLAAGDILVLMTDGVTEARNSSEEEYGLERLKALVSSHANSSAQHLRDRIIEDIRQFTGQTPQHDDLTLVVAKLT